MTLLTGWWSRPPRTLISGVLENSLKGHPTLQYLDLSDNPHGGEGLRSLFRLLVRPES